MNIEIAALRMLEAEKNVPAVARRVDAESQAMKLGRRLPRASP